MRVACEACGRLVFVYRHPERGLVMMPHRVNEDRGPHVPLCDGLDELIRESRALIACVEARHEQEAEERAGYEDALARARVKLRLVGA